MLLLAAILLLSGCTGPGPSGSPASPGVPVPSRPSASPGPGAATPGPPCGPDDTLFTVPPVALGRVVALTPLGQLTPPDHVFPAPHNYIYVIDYRKPRDVETPVYAPGNMSLREVGLRHYNAIGQYKNYIDYTLVFSVCPGFELYFHHIRNLTYGPIADVARKILEGCRFSTERNEDYCSGSADIPVQSGQPLGTVGDLKGGVYGLDIGARDLRASKADRLANAPRFCDRESPIFGRCYVVCPFDYFRPDVRRRFQFSNGRTGTAVPECGNVYADMAGRAQGYWFRKGSAQTLGESENLFIGPDNLNPPVRVFSVGTSIPSVSPGLYDFAPSPSGLVNRDPRDVPFDRQVYCYELGGRANITLLLRMTSPASLQIGRSSLSRCGEGPWSLGTGSAEFER